MSTFNHFEEYHRTFIIPNIAMFLSFNNWISGISKEQESIVQLLDEHEGTYAKAVDFKDANETLAQIINLFHCQSHDAENINDKGLYVYIHNMEFKR
jgi:hypothetical protein